MYFKTGCLDLQKNLRKKIKKIGLGCCINTDNVRGTTDSEISITHNYLSNLHLILAWPLYAASLVLFAILSTVRRHCGTERIRILLSICSTTPLISIQPSYLPLSILGAAFKPIQNWMQSRQAAAAVACFTYDYAAYMHIAYMHPAFQLSKCQDFFIYIWYISEDVHTLWHMKIVFIWKLFSSRVVYLLASFIFY